MDIVCTVLGSRHHFNCCWCTPPSPSQKEKKLNKSEIISPKRKIGPKIDNDQWSTYSKPSCSTVVTRKNNNHFVPMWKGVWPYYFFIFLFLWSNINLRLVIWPERMDRQARWYCLCEGKVLVKEKTVRKYTLKLDFSFVYNISDCFL